MVEETQILIVSNVTLVDVKWAKVWTESIMLQCPPLMHARMGATLLFETTGFETHLTPTRRSWVSIAAHTVKTSHIRLKAGRTCCQSEVGKNSVMSFGHSAGADGYTAVSFTHTHPHTVCTVYQTSGFKGDT